MEEDTTSCIKRVGGVTEVLQFYGTQTKIKIAEKAKIYNYFLQNGQLPLGNKIFR